MWKFLVVMATLFSMGSTACAQSVCFRAQEFLDNIKSHNGEDVVVTGTLAGGDGKLELVIVANAKGEFSIIAQDADGFACALGVGTDLDAGGLKHMREKGT